MLSWQTKTLWAKKPKGNTDERWLPLAVHMSDAAGIARLLWQHWVPACTRRKISSGLQMGGESDFYSEDAALSCFVFLAAAHDFGKATPSFQGNLRCTELDEQLHKQITDAGLPLTDNIHPRVARHYWASQLILEKYRFSRKLAVILGGHHGQPPSSHDLCRLREGYKKDLGWGKEQEAWVKAQQELLTYTLKLAHVSEQEAQSWQPDITAQVLLSGLVIMADWIVSNETYFPYIALYEGARSSTERANIAWKHLRLPEYWIPDNAYVQNDFYRNRFHVDPRPVQTTILDVLKKILYPGIVIIEAPMGEGKTEAALAAAELMANRTGRSGVFFALPTQASANGLFLRFCNWIERLDDGVAHSVKLAHGKADLNELYNKLPKRTEEIGDFTVGGEENEETVNDALIVHEWFSGRKKGILADFVIGTIDQVLMGSLKQKHLALRHLGLANKVVILDECHAYDAYMSQYLYKVLNWLGAYGVPVIILSATLPGEKRQHLIEAYLNSSSSSEDDPLFDKDKPAPALFPWAATLDYPIITCTDGSKMEDVRQKEIAGKERLLNVKLDTLSSDEEVISKLDDLLAEGGCAGIIVNTVKRAQNIAKVFSQHFCEGQIHLLHSRFLAIDRAQKEKELFARLGTDGERPQRCIVVGTQIFEQSCDLDFDVLITDICPMDLLIQRIGRLHRHEQNERMRPDKLKDAQCYIIGLSDTDFDSGAESIYGKYLLMNTRFLLQPHMTLPLKLPDDIQRLVQETYCSDGLLMPPELQDEYKKAQSEHECRIDKKKTKACTFQISDPYKGPDNLVDWLDTSITDDPSGKRGEATVRDTENSLEVLVVQRLGQEYSMLPWLAKFKGEIIPTDTPPNTKLAQAMAECSIQLPRELCCDLDKTIKELEKISLHDLCVWQQSSWLKGELFLVLDEQLSAELCGYHLQYDQSYGLVSEKIEKGDGSAGENI